jgi:Ca2+-binding RTX toxin-like protein
MAGSRTEPVPTPALSRNYVAPNASGVATGTAGADDIFATGAGQRLVGNGGSDIFHLGTNTDARIEVSAADEGSSVVNTVSLWAANYTLPDLVDNLIGNGDYAHSLTGNGRANFISGAGGNDTLRGEGGNDWLVGGGGSDTLIGGFGDDRLDGGTGRDIFVAGGGTEGTDTILNFEAGAAGDRINLVNPLGLTDFESIRSQLQTIDGGGFRLNVGHKTHLEIHGANLTLDSFVPENFLIDGQPVPSGGSGGGTPSSTEHGLVLRVSEDFFQGDAQFTLVVDGTQIAGPQQVTGLHGRGEWQHFGYVTNLSAGTHTITVNFTNDLYGGSSTADRNLWVDWLSVDGVKYEGEAAQNVGGSNTVDPTAGGLFSNGSLTFTVTVGAGASGQHLVGDAHNDRLNGGPGNDFLEGLALGDVLVGNAGDDRLEGGDGLNFLDGGPGNDTLRGGIGADNLVGGPGADMLDGGSDCRRPRRRHARRRQRRHRGRQLCRESGGRIDRS